MDGSLARSAVLPGWTLRSPSARDPTLRAKNARRGPRIGGTRFVACIPRLGSEIRTERRGVCVLMSVVNQTLANGVLVDVVAPDEELFAIFDEMVGEAALPDG